MTTYLAIGAVGVALLAVSLVLGDLLDGAFDALAGDVFSTAVIGGFVAAFGFGGALALAWGAPGLVAAPVGVAAGTGFGWFAWWLTRLVKDGGSDHTPSVADTMGREGRVLSPIPLDGFGSVRVMVGGHTMQLNARAYAELEAGTVVHVTGVLSPTAVSVAPVWNPTNPSPPSAEG